MTLKVNGDKFELDGAATVAALLEAYGVNGRRVAVLLNDEPVPEPKRAGTPLAEGDVVEILTCAGGG